MNGGLQPCADVDRIYVHQSLDGCGLLGAEDSVMSECPVLVLFKDALMKKVLLSGIAKTPMMWLLLLMPLRTISMLLLSDLER